MKTKKIAIAVTPEMKAFFLMRADKFDMSVNAALNRITIMKEESLKKYIQTPLSKKSEKYTETINFETPIAVYHFVNKQAEKENISDAEALRRIWHHNKNRIRLTAEERLIQKYETRMCYEK